jgi:hypothetical protein
MNVILFLLTFLTLNSSVVQAQEECTTTCSSYTTCTTCLGTCNSCLYTTVPDPDVTNKSVTSLPIDFIYSHDDTNKANDTCESTECSTKTCTGKTNDENRSLPAAWKGDACTLAPNNKIPATLNCRYRDYYCSSYCTRSETYSCCEAYTTTCTTPEAAK